MKIIRLNKDIPNQGKKWLTETIGRNPVAALSDYNIVADTSFINQEWIAGIVKQFADYET